MAASVVNLQQRELTPEGEARRLAAMQRYEILDTPPDGSFDRITAIAARLFCVPISIISLVDHDRIWFKSYHGLNVPQIDRGPGLCASAILQDAPGYSPTPGTTRAHSPIGRFHILSAYEYHTILRVWKSASRILIGFLGNVCDGDGLVSSGQYFDLRRLTANDRARFDIAKPRLPGLFPVAPFFCFGGDASSLLE